ncbi:MAG: hypothetical protein ABI557_12925, partial [Aureliella sp.]
RLSADEMVIRIKEAFDTTLKSAEPMQSSHLAAIKREVQFQVRSFDEQAEDQAVREYCQKYAPSHADEIVQVFRDSRAKLKPFQGESRPMWLQTMRIGDVVLVGVPAEFFTALGLEIKRRSPYRNTFICGLSNDYIGYTPSLQGFENGGYQAWMGLHSFSEKGTGEMIVEECLKMLDELQ